MPKSQRNRSESAKKQQTSNKSFIAVDEHAFDPSVASLFASSLGPVQAPPKSRYQNLPEKRPLDDASEDDESEETGSESEAGNSEEDSDVDGGAQLEEEASSSSEDGSSDDESVSEASQSNHETVLARVQESILNGEQERPNKKRKRAKGEDVEDTYMRKLAREEVMEEEQRKKQRTEVSMADGDNTVSQSDDSDADSFTIPKHETQDQDAPKNSEELDKAGRTVFLGNVSNDAITNKSAKNILIKHLQSFVPDLADNDPPHKVESIRFRSTAFASALPKKAAFAKKEVLDATTKSTNAYAVYSTKVAAREAAKRLNGTIVLKRHLRVDWIAHPAPTDHKRCVFVGNLGFVDDESSIKPDEDDKKKKVKPPGDVEEGLWVQFSKAGKVESVRVVRDPKTRVGKGIAYVQFEDQNGVEAALEFNDQKYPPLLPRKLRVVRAKAPRPKKKPEARPAPTKSNAVYNAKKTEQQRSQEGRAKAMLGKAGAFKSAEKFVFEGHRASNNQGRSGLKLGGNKKKSGKPSNRSTKRAAAYRASGGKK
ncbi:hypothetical protein BDV96DRAFT_607136 [Lophiotrema nucula]|uniref:Nucleolar protein 12 n=1 Tax=Lophiotrema nucula TaxID=690887 RepID=A0A6A5YHC1_9PLEO|nr:hypothetical protein BDV96DRAFT_607136 [Lophiotrema nucula]